MSAAGTLGDLESLENELKVRNRELHHANDRKAVLEKQVKEWQVKYTELLGKLSAAEGEANN